MLMSGGPFRNSHSGVFLLNMQEISSAAGFPPYPLVASLSIPVLSMILAAMEPSEHIDTFVMNCTEPNLAWMPAYICRSASCCISRFCGAFEEHMDVL